MIYQRNGTILPIQKQWEIKFGPLKATQMTTQYHGTDLPQMMALANRYARSQNGSIKWGGAIAELTLENPDTSGGAPGGLQSPGNSIIDKWEVAVNQKQPDLFENNNFMNLFYNTDLGYGVAVSQQIAAAVRSMASGENATWMNLVEKLKTTNVVDINGVKVSGDRMLWKAIADLGSQWIVFFKYFVDDYLRGRTSFTHSSYTLRHTTVAPGSYAANVTDFNVEKIYLIPELLAECNNASLWVFTLPGFLNYKILNYETPTAASMPPNYVWGALKMRGSALSSYNNKIEITQEYLIDACAKHTYGLAYPT
jgi:hypothetical protein